MRVSTSAWSAAMPDSAWVERRRPSKVKGRVTTPMVRGAEAAGDLRDDGRAARAGAAALAGGHEDHVGPRAGPPRSPRRGPRRPSCPPRGRRRAPRPRVISLPTSSLTSASDMRSAWASVLIAMNSTPLSPDSIMRLTALTPPPPTPTTLMTAREIWVPATFGPCSWLLLVFLEKGLDRAWSRPLLNPGPLLEVRTSGRLSFPSTLRRSARARKHRGRVSGASRANVTVPVRPIRRTAGCPPARPRPAPGARGAGVAAEEVSG